MKPVQIGLLVALGALSGALVMKVWQRTPPLAQSMAQVEQTAAPAVPSAPAALPEPAAEPAPVAKELPAQEKPFAPPRRPVRVAKRPVIIARNEPAPVVAPPPPPAAPPEQPKETPAQAPSFIPPARQEPEQVTPPPPPPPEPNRVTLNAGLLIPVRLIDGLSTERNAPGDPFLATLEKELVVDGFVIAERGARVDGRVVAADRAGKLSGVASLAVELTSIHTSDGQKVAIQTDPFARHAEASHRQNAEKVAGGAAVGAIVGAIAGGGKGAAIGAGVGGGAGAGDVLLTRGKPATLPSETRLSFRLRAPVTVTEKVY